MSKNNIVEGEKSYSEQQAIAQLESIVEMIANLTIEGAAHHYVKDLELDKVKALLIEAEIIEDNPSEDGTEQPEEDLREKLEQAIAEETITPSDFEFDEESARQTIQEDPLSVQVRTGWYNPGSMDAKAEEFEILLCTGGPAVRLRGELNEHMEPDRVWIEHQDWGTPWTQYFAESHQIEAMLEYCRQFYFGE